jgi:transcriptional regulator with XRE-family HTH domain
MQTAILTPSQARDARESIALSQGRVAADTGVSRSYLSQFECGKLVLADSDLESLRAFYESRGASFDEAPEDDPATAGPNGPRIRDGLHIPDGVSREAADAILGHMAHSDQLARELLTADAPRGLFGVDSGKARDSARKAVRLMAHNWALLQSLQGRGVTRRADTAEVGVLEVAMRDDVLRESFHVPASEDFYRVGRGDAPGCRADQSQGRRFLRKAERA